MSLKRSEKQAVITQVTDLAAQSQALVMAQYRGLTVAQLTQLRSTARQEGVQVRVLKNTLARRAVVGSSFELLVDQMSGPLIYGFSKDPMAAAKTFTQFAKTNDKLLIQAGVYAGKVLNTAEVKQLASIPSKEILLSQLLGLLQSPVASLARVLGAIAAQKQGTSPSAEADPAA